jgi:hypothetical protein
MLKKVEITPCISNQPCGSVCPTTAVYKLAVTLEDEAIPMLISLCKGHLLFLLSDMGLL